MGGRIRTDAAARRGEKRGKEEEEVSTTINPFFRVQLGLCSDSGKERNHNAIHLYNKDFSPLDECRFQTRQMHLFCEQRIPDNENMCKKGGLFADTTRAAERHLPASAPTNREAGERQIAKNDIIISVHVTRQVDLCQALNRECVNPPVSVSLCA